MRYLRAAGVEGILLSLLQPLLLLLLLLLLMPCHTALV